MLITPLRQSGKLRGSLREHRIKVISFWIRRGTLPATAARTQHLGLVSADLTAKRRLMPVHFSCNFGRAFLLEVVKDKSLRLSGAVTQRIVI